MGVFRLKMAEICHFFKNSLFGAFQHDITQKLLGLELFEDENQIKVECLKILCLYFGMSFSIWFWGLCPKNDHFSMKSGQNIAIFQIITFLGPFSMG